MAVLNYVSGFLDTTLSSSLASTSAGASDTLVIPVNTPVPVSYPFTFLLEWGTSGQEVVTCTGAPTGSGPYSFPVTRGEDGTTAGAHAAGAKVNTGVSARDFTRGAASDITASAAGDAAAAGTTGKVADAAHRHGREAFASPAAQTSFGLASAAGTAVTLARSDHVHGTPALSATATDIQALGTRAAGSTGNGADAGHVHPPQLAGGLITPNIVTKTAAYTLAATDEIVLCNAAGGAFTITLPTAAGVTGQTYVIKKTDSAANTVTVATTSSQLIDGASTWKLIGQYQMVTVASDGTGWQVTGTGGPGAWNDLGTISLVSTTVTTKHYRALPAGEVEIEVIGSVSASSSPGTHSFSVTLPASFTPSETKTCAVGCTWGVQATGNSWPAMDVNTSGVVEMRLPPTGGGAINVFGARMTYPV